MKYQLSEYHRNIPDEQLLNDILRVALNLGKDSISKNDYKKNGGSYGVNTICRRFGGWLNALQQCGLSPNKCQINNVGISMELMITDLQNVATTLNKTTVSSLEYSQYGQYSRDIFTKKFGSWNAALEAAGLRSYDHPLGNANNKIETFIYVIGI